MKERQIYEENKEATRPTGVHLRKLEQEYMKEQTEVKENHLAQQLSWLLNNKHFYYDEKFHTNNNNEKKTTIFTA